MGRDCSVARETWHSSLKKVKKFYFIDECWVSSSQRVCNCQNHTGTNSPILPESAMGSSFHNWSVGHESLLFVPLQKTETLRLKVTWVAFPKERTMLNWHLLEHESNKTAGVWMKRTSISIIKMNFLCCLGEMLGFFVCSRIMVLQSDCTYLSHTILFPLTIVLAN